MTPEMFEELVESVIPGAHVEYVTRATLHTMPETEAVIYTNWYLDGDDNLEPKR